MKKAELQFKHGFYFDKCNKHGLMSLMMLEIYSVVNI